ncbi:hypothetical protein [Flammeovirga kamogawensis]|uniref:Uncharacterized protein n=1 Tax=Flammeovirga kamogawensis TaxID=373891 RepID=A0ABX8GVN5_9BACT|nr:hypothetical protein [Flammeovirga kamogawensis]MBB6461083.1 hypothetical protein [Flammeovirga kamogawensis]QWG07651.1 hypothetical protein KM029_01570 [Flammeovirga kamogawensis]TRX69461.1 hypothetical protein EO216_15510 [Flammeovirga kamogawensis]
MKIAEFTINNDYVIDVFLFPEGSEIAVTRFEGLVSSNIYNNWSIKYVVEGNYMKFAPEVDYVHFSDRPLTRIDFGKNMHRMGVLSFIGSNTYQVSDRLMFIMNNETGKSYDGICAPIGVVAIDHQKKLEQLKEGMKIEKIIIKDLPKEEILARIPAFI